MGAADPRYPIGPFHFDGKTGASARRERIEHIAEMPAKLRSAVADLSDLQLDTPYREGGWTVRQVVHHLPDSHLNAYVRIKLALTEDSPTIRPYDQERWAERPEAQRAPIEPSLQLIDGLHVRWISMLEAMTEGDWKRSYFHPESQRHWSMDEVVAMYAWHSRHHVGHITTLRQREGW